MRKIHIAVVIFFILFSLSAYALFYEFKTLDDFKTGLTKARMDYDKPYLLDPMAGEAGKNMLFGIKNKEIILSNNSVLQGLSTGRTNLHDFIYLKPFEGGDDSRYYYGLTNAEWTITGGKTLEVGGKYNISGGSRGQSNPFRLHYTFTLDRASALKETEFNKTVSFFGETFSIKIRSGQPTAGGAPGSVPTSVWFSEGDSISAETQPVINWQNMKVFNTEYNKKNYKTWGAGNWILFKKQYDDKLMSFVAINARNMDNENIVYNLFVYVLPLETNMSVYLPRPGGPFNSGETSRVGGCWEYNIFGEEYSYLVFLEAGEINYGGLFGIGSNNVPTTIWSKLMKKEHECTYYWQKAAEPVAEPQDECTPKIEAVIATPDVVTEKDIRRWEKDSASGELRHNGKLASVDWEEDFYVKFNVGPESCNTKIWTLEFWKTDPSKGKNYDDRIELALKGTGETFSGSIAKTFSFSKDLDSIEDGIPLQTGSSGNYNQTTLGEALGDSGELWLRVETIDTMDSVGKEWRESGTWKFWYGEKPVEEEPAAEPEPEEDEILEAGATCDTCSTIAQCLACIDTKFMRDIYGVESVTVTNGETSDSETENGEGTGEKDNGDTETFLAERLIWPAPDNYHIYSCYGDRPNVGNKFHDGIDILLDRGSDVLASADGTVLKTCDYSSTNKCGYYGTYVRVQHSETLITAYYHLDERLVDEGDAVTRGQVIGKSGKTAINNDRAHLHFAVYDSVDNAMYGSTDTAINPMCKFNQDVLSQVMVYEPNHSCNAEENEWFFAYSQSDKSGCAWASSDNVPYYYEFA